MNNRMILLIIAMLSLSASAFAQSAHGQLNKPTHGQQQHNTTRPQNNKEHKPASGQHGYHKPTPGRPSHGKPSHHANHAPELKPMSAPMAKMIQRMMGNRQIKMPTHYSVRSTDDKANHRH